MQKYRALDRGIWLIALARMITTMGFSIVLPFMAIYFVDQRHTTLATYGWIVCLAGILSALAQRIAGNASDRLGRKPLMIVALLLRAVNMASLGIAVWFGAPLWVLALFLITNRILWGVFEPAAVAAITDLASQKQRVAAFGIQRMGVNLGWAIGPTLGGFLLAFTSYGVIFLVAAPATLLSAFAISFVGGQASQPTSREEQPSETLLSTLAGVGRENPRFLVYLGLVFMTALVAVQVFSTLSTFADQVLQLSKTRIGMVYAVNAGVVLLLQLPAVAAIERIGRGAAILLGCALFAVGFLCLGVSTGFWTMAIGVAILTTGEVFLTPAILDMVAVLVDPARMGRAFGLFGFMKGMGVSFGPLLGGLAFDHFQQRPIVLWGIVAAVTTLAFVGHAAFLRHHQIWRPAGH